MNLQNLMSQLKMSTNPMAMMMGLLNPSQKQQVNQIQGLNKEQQAEKIAEVCNEKGITKEQLQSIINNFK